jgi:hypothetical protein
MSTILDIALDQWPGILIVASQILCLIASGWLQRRFTRRAEERERDAIQASAARYITAATANREAARLIELGMQIMSAAQVNRWEGVREWLMLNAGHSGPYADDKGENGAGIEEPAREGHPNAIFEAGGSTDPSYGADAMGGEKSLSGRKSSPFVARQQPFTLRNADADLTHPGYPPEYNLTPAEIAERLRVGIMDIEEPGDADAGFPDWTPKAQRPF